MTTYATTHPAGHRQTTSRGQSFRLSHLGKFSGIEPRDQRPPPPLGPSREDGLSPPPEPAAVEFGRYRLLLRQRQLFADGVPVELGTRAFELLLLLLEADGSLVTKDELFRRVWPGVVVTEENLKVQIHNLRRALGEDRDLIRTDFGRGYRFVAVIRTTIDRGPCERRRRRPRQPRARSCFLKAMSEAPIRTGAAARSS